MGTLYSDIYIDGENSEVFAIDGAQIKEAWLNGECIWRLVEREEITVVSVYHIVYHEEMWYVIFAGKKATGGTYNYLGTCIELGNIIDYERITLGGAIGDYITCETPNGLFMYRSQKSNVASDYLFWENYDIHKAALSSLAYNPFGKPTALFDNDLLAYAAVITNDCIIRLGGYVGTPGSEDYAALLKKVDLNNNELGTITSPTSSVHLSPLINGEILVDVKGGEEVGWFQLNAGTLALNEYSISVENIYQELCNAGNIEKVSEKWVNRVSGICVRNKIHFIITANVTGRMPGIAGIIFRSGKFLCKDDGSYSPVDADYFDKYFLVFDDNEVVGHSNASKLLITHNDKIIDGDELLTEASRGIASMSSNFFVYYKYRSINQGYIREMVYLQGETYKTESLPEIWTAER